jgi:hypothetical protein
VGFSFSKKDDFIHDCTQVLVLVIAFGKGCSHEIWGIFREKLATVTPLGWGPMKIASELSRMWISGAFRNRNR